MARKPKRMALYEAIRQGQVKIAKGLESGHMRSDGRVNKKGVHEPVHDENALLNDHGKIPGISALSKTFAIVSGLAVLVILLFGIWLGMHFGGTSEPETMTQTPVDQQGILEDAPNDKVAQEEEESSGFLGFGGKKPVQETTSVPAAEKPTVPQGDNVIVIQQVPGADQQDKLLPIQAFYTGKGIPTEMIQRSGYTLLVTKAGFDHNPNREGTEGYRLIQRIKQLGLAYPEATGDTKFGLKPFQDAYPLKR